MIEPEIVNAANAAMQALGTSVILGGGMSLLQGHRKKSMLFSLHPRISLQGVGSAANAHTIPATESSRESVFAVPICGEKFSLNTLALYTLVQFECCLSVILTRDVLCTVGILFSIRNHNRRAQVVLYSNSQ